MPILFYVGIPGYEPPGPESVDFIFEEEYTPPEGDEIDFDFDE